MRTMCMSVWLQHCYLASDEQPKWNLTTWPIKKELRRKTYIESNNRANTNTHCLTHTHTQYPTKKEIKWRDCQKHQPQRVALINVKNVCPNFNNAKLSLYPAQPIILSCSSLVPAACFGHGLFARSSSNLVFILDTGEDTQCHDCALYHSHP